MHRTAIGLAVSSVAMLMLLYSLSTAAIEPAADPSAAPTLQTFVQAHCLDCHTGSDASGDLDLETTLAHEVVSRPEVWERVVRKLAARQMPPADMPRPDEAEYESVLRSLTAALDRHAGENPRPGRTETFRRLTRFEYQNAIRDLLAVDIDASRLLPRDESSHGFDNITVGELTPTLLNRYVNAAQEISRLAVGVAGPAPGGDTIRIRPDITQESHVAGLPLGTRGGAVIPYTFPVDGEYQIEVRLARDRNEEVEGLRGRHELDILVDRDQVARFTIEPPPRGSRDYSKVDAHLQTRIHVSAGPHELGVTFPGRSTSLLETMRQPYESHFNYHRHPRINTAVYQVSVTGPYESNGPGDTPSRRRIFVCRPTGPDEEPDCAETILANLARRAWRRPVQGDDIAGLLEFYRQGRDEGDFETGIQRALEALLVSPQFLFRIERDPAGAAPGEVYAVSDVELASRLSFFLWSSIPDEELLELAEADQLRRPDVLAAQVRRMLADPRAKALTKSFAGQWLYLRNLDAVHPDGRLFPDFDHNLREAMRRETELLFEDVARNDRSVLDLLKSDKTFLNQRLAKHYGIPHVYGSRFRKVAPDEDVPRGGLLRHASILAVTSYATRTSPVIRGNWILENLVGTPAPPPPADVPALEDNTVAADLPIRERLKQHRADPNCAGCHALMDPVGFSLENFDAIGRWRNLEGEAPVDATGGLPDGSEFEGVEGLEQALLRRPELFAGTVTEKLLTYALGRGLDHHDAPAVRQIVHDAALQDYRFSAIVHGIVRSTPFQMRTAE
ncbi:hypothetical protein Mal4_36810 [Maioricimonas rarisocia]|uniref:Planctomycete cytochrome C n=1 Tax=Maioricimonas rarisocia TaxID=2528026 RepID=A0A517ZA78_9PLAN|nr:DUF1592 domain-containing protein [Maioricimonas rarisocia]QDU39340.1 hypothetical protein Mal4_36810 [Maioricimonas rarisocia]